MKEKKMPDKDVVPELRKSIREIIAIDKMPLWANHVDTLLVILNAAKFSAKNVIFGKALYRVVPDISGIAALAQTRQINQYTKCVVIVAEGDEDHFASYWLDHFLFSSIIMFSSNPYSKELEDKKVSAENFFNEAINKRNPFRPLTLTDKGDTLHINEESVDAIDPLNITYTTDDDPLEIHPFVGHHSCGGEMERIQCSTQYFVLRCRHCGLRIEYDNRVVTYGDIRQIRTESKPKT